MSLFERRQRVERLLQAAKEPDGATARLRITELLNETAAAASQDMSILLAAITIAAGGKIVVEGDTFGRLSPLGGLVFEEDWRTGAVTLSAMSHLAEAMSFAANRAEMQAHPPAARALVIDRDADLRQELRAYLDTLVITSDNIGDIRRAVFMPWDSPWNGWVRDETAARENKPKAAGAPLAPSAAPTDLAPPAADYPPANPDEPEGVARARICNAFRTLVQRHYDGEVKARGFGFMETVTGELLAMAIGVRLAGDIDPETPTVALNRIGEQIVPRILEYQRAVEHVHAANAPEPGESPAPESNPSRLH